MERSAKFVTGSDRFDGDVTVGLGGYTEPAKRSSGKRIALWALGIFAALLVIASAGFYFYWAGLRSTPQYSLALIIDAAKQRGSCAHRTDIGGGPDVS